MGPGGKRASGTSPGALAFSAFVLGLAGVVAAGPAAIPGPPAATIAFTDQATAAGLTFRSTYGNKDTSAYILETTGTGVAFLDYDRDGFLDAFLANGTTLEGPKGAEPPRCALFRNKGDGTFEDATLKAAVARSGWGQGVAVGDYDNDGFPDVYLTFFGSNVLFRNNGDGTFGDVTAKAGVAADGWSTSAAFADYDRDGDLDLYVARYVAFDVAAADRPGTRPNCFYRGFPVMCGPRGLSGERDILYRNDGDGRFSDVTAQAGGLDADRLRGLGAVWGDYDDDGWPDLFVANDAHPNLLYHNNRDGSFSERAFEAGVAFDEDGRERAGMGTDFGDYDNDGRLDLVITNFYGEPNSLYLNQGEGTFLETTWLAGIGDSTLRYLGWGTAFADLDNDGWKDLFFVNGHVYPEVDRHGMDEKYAQQSLVFRNQGDGRFSNGTPTAGEALSVLRAGRGAAFGDYDNDGELDVLIASVNEAPALLRNQTASGNHWLGVRLVGRVSNRDGLGARITAVVGARTLVHEVHGGGSYLSQSDLRAHFGLGPETSVKSLTVRWPSGTLQRIDDVPADGFIVLDEKAGVVARRDAAEMR